jgi:hypothetical protein
MIRNFAGWMLVATFGSLALLGFAQTFAELGAMLSCHR